jgi:transcription elongation factor Elf1
MGICLLIWVIFCAVQFIRHSKTLVAGADFIGHVECEKCKTRYDVSASEFARSSITKSRSVSKTKLKNGAFINRPYYQYFAKKFNCPVCGKKRYARVLNINEINDLMLKPSLNAGIHWLIIMFIGGVIIMAAASIPRHFTEKAAQQRVEELKEQQYQEFIQRYQH